MIWRIVKLVLKSLSVFLILICVYLTAAFLLPKWEVPAEPQQAAEETIYILTNGVHTDIVVSAKNTLMDWRKLIKPSHTLANDSNATYLAFGWGDKGFYLETPTWADLKVSTAVKAAFALSTTALHATYYNQMTENESCYAISISRLQYLRLVNYILKSLQWKNNKPIYISTEANYGKNDAFYEATGHYSLFTTCNTWANNALKACGQKSCWWTASDKGIFDLYKSK